VTEGYFKTLSPKKIIAISRKVTTKDGTKTDTLIKTNLTDYPTITSSPGSIRFDINDKTYTFGTQRIGLSNHDIVNKNVELIKVEKIKKCIFCFAYQVCMKVDGKKRNVSLSDGELLVFED